MLFWLQLTVEVKLISKTLKGLSENKDLGERGERGEGDFIQCLVDDVTTGKYKKVS